MLEFFNWKSIDDCFLPHPPSQSSLFPFRPPPSIHLHNSSLHPRSTDLRPSRNVILLLTRARMRTHAHTRNHVFQTRKYHGSWFLPRHRRGRGVAPVHARSSSRNTTGARRRVPATAVSVARALVEGSVHPHDVDDVSIVSVSRPRATPTATDRTRRPRYRDDTLVPPRGYPRTRSPLRLVSRTVREAHVESGARCPSRSFGNVSSCAHFLPTQPSARATHQKLFVLPAHPTHPYLWRYRRPFDEHCGSAPTVVSVISFSRANVGEKNFKNFQKIEKKKKKNRSKRFRHPFPRAYVPRFRDGFE